MSELVQVYDTDGAVEALPPDAQYFLSYDDGNPIGREILARFPHATLITITTVPEANNLSARIADCEPSAFSPEQAAAWAKAKITLGHRPCIYVNVSEKPAVEEALAAYGLEFARDVDCWLAWWNGIAEIPEGIFRGVGCGYGNIAMQYMNYGKLYDISVAFLDWISPSPPDPPAPPEELMDAIEIVGTPTYPKGGIFLNGGQVWIGPLDEDSVAELKANKATIFQSKSNSVFNAKTVVPYPAK